MEIIILQVILGIILFLLINWIGKHSYSIGYMGISIFIKAEEAPALNFLIRALTPIVYLIIISALLYSFNLDKFVVNIYLVNIYYIIFRLIINLITGRGKLLNWNSQILYWIIIITLSYFVYDKIIRVKINILPDFTTIANELWIIIILFIFQITNKIKLSSDGIQNRKENYLKSKYKYFNKQYGKIIKDSTQNEVLESVVYAIMIYENFNRPKVIRLVENVKQFLTKKTLTLGIMQVKSKKIISDKESVVLGTKKIMACYKKYKSKMKKEKKDMDEWSAIYHIVSDYNIGSDYLYEVTDLSSEIKKLFYHNTKDSLGKSFKE